MASKQDVLRQNTSAIQQSLMPKIHKTTYC